MELSLSKIGVSNDHQVSRGKGSRVHLYRLAGVSRASPVPAVLTPASGSTAHQVRVGGDMDAERTNNNGEYPKFLATGLHVSRFIHVKDPIAVTEWQHASPVPDLALQHLRLGEQAGATFVFLAFSCVVICFMHSFGHRRNSQFVAADRSFLSPPMLRPARGVSSSL